MLDYNILTAMVLIIALVLLIVYVFPYMKKRGITKEIYQEIQLGLLLFGYAFRDDKVKRIVDILMGVVLSIEKLDIAPYEKKKEAVDEVFKQLLEDLNICLDQEAVEVLVNIAVSYLPPTNIPIEEI